MNITENHTEENKLQGPDVPCVKILVQAELRPKQLTFGSTSIVTKACVGFRADATRVVRRSEHIGTYLFEPVQRVSLEFLQLGIIFSKISLKRSLSG